MISNFVNGNIENINLSFLYNKETTEIKKINGKFINIKAILKNNIIVAIDDGIIGLEKKNEVVLKANGVFN